MQEPSITYHMVRFVASHPHVVALPCPALQNHRVWAVDGEPAYVKVWLRSPAGLTAARALRAEEGFAPDFLTATLAAYLRGCGVRASRVRT